MGGCLAGSLIEYCSVRVTRTEILDYAILFLFIYTGPKSDNMQLHCQLYHHQRLSKHISNRENKYFLIDLTFEESKIVRWLLFK